MPTQTVIDLAEQFSADLERKGAVAIRRTINNYRALRDRLQDSIDAVTLTIEKEQPTRAQAAKMQRLKTLQAQTEREINDFSGWLGTELRGVSRVAVGVGASATTQMTLWQTGGVAIGWNRLNTGAIEKLLGFMEPTGPLYKRLGLMGQFVAQGVRAAILEGVGLGYNPRKIAAEITKALGVGLTDALRITRTAQLYSYREASRAMMLANENIVRGWYWFAALDDRVCLSCVAQHGTFHPSTERLNDHYNGRCAMVPAVIEQESPVEQGGEDWFNKLSDQQKLAMMGPGKYQAWKDGKFSFDKLSAISPDDVYGDMRIEATLEELLRRAL